MFSNGAHDKEKIMVQNNWGQEAQAIHTPAHPFQHQITGPTPSVGGIHDSDP